MSEREVEIGGTHVCDDEFGVTQVISRGGKGDDYMRRPCAQCPWREDLPTGVVPPEAFRHSAATAYDMAGTTFGCHMSGTGSPMTCAGFLLRHGVHNMQVRLTMIHTGLAQDEVTDGGFPVYQSYREMAIANGVDERDPALRPIRSNDE